MVRVRGVRRIKQQRMGVSMGERMMNHERMGVRITQERMGVRIKH